MSDIKEELKKLNKLTIQEEIALTYLHPGYPTETSKKILNDEILKNWKMSDEKQMEIFSIQEMLRKEREKEITNDESRKEHEEKTKAWIMMLLRLHLEATELHRRNEILIMMKQIIESRELLENDMRILLSRINQIDLELAALDRKILLHEKEHERLQAQLAAIRFEKPIRVMIDAEHNLFVDIDGNKLVAFLQENADTNTPCHTLVKRYFQDEINKVVDERRHELPLAKVEQYRNIINDKPEIFETDIKENKLDEVMNIIDKDKIEVKETNEARAKIQDKKKEKKLRMSQLNECQKLQSDDPSKMSEKELKEYQGKLNKANHEHFVSQGNINKNQDINKIPVSSSNSQSQERDLLARRFKQREARINNKNHSNPEQYEIGSMSDNDRKPGKIYFDFNVNGVRCEMMRNEKLVKSSIAWDIIKHLYTLE